MPQSPRSSLTLQFPYPTPHMIGDSSQPISVLHIAGWWRFSAAYMIRLLTLARMQNQQAMSEDDLSLFREYSPDNPLKSKPHYVSSNQNIFIWHFYESYAETAITKPSDESITPHSLAEGDIYLHTRFAI